MSKECIHFFGPLCICLNINQLDALNFIMILFHASTCFEEVKIVLYRLWYHHTYRWPSRAQVKKKSVFKSSLDLCNCISFLARTTVCQDTVLRVSG